jgi:hypothetical protein
MNMEWKLIETNQKNGDRHPKCKGYKDEMNGDYDCLYRSNLSCDECKYGAGRKDPEAKCNEEL